MLVSINEIWGIKSYSIPVSTADTFDPAVRGEQLGVPAVAGVVRHLVGHVLPEPQPLLVDADLDQELLDARHEVSQGLVGDGGLRVLGMTYL